VVTRPTHAPIRIGVFFDGSFWFHLHHYWLHHHPAHQKLAVDGVQDAARWYAREVFSRPVEDIVIEQAHHFQAARSINSTFQAVLDRMHITRHELEFDSARNRAIGVEVELALTCWDQTAEAGLDMVMLVTGNYDYRPLVTRLVRGGVRVLIPQIDVSFTDRRTRKRIWITTSEHLCAVATDSPTWEQLVEATQSEDYPLISPLLREDRRIPVRRPAHWRS
jgi:hypothetical protein